MIVIYIYIYNTRVCVCVCVCVLGTAVTQWLRCCATNREVAGSTQLVSFRLHYGPGVDSASHRNEYQEYFLGVKAAGA